MKNVMIVGAARDARTRTKRAQAAVRKRRVRIGGIHRVRPNRSLSFTPAQCMEHEAELRANFDAGLILFQDGNGRAVPLEMVFGGKAPAAPPKAAASTADTDPAPAEDDTTEDTSEEDTTEFPTEGDDESEEDDAQPLPEGYEDYTKKELLALFEGRLPVPEDTRNDSLVEALATWEDENFE